jgi:hypothetical protein
VTSSSRRMNRGSAYACLGTRRAEGGVMWNSNSVIAWLIATGGLPTELLRQLVHIPESLPSRE